MRRVLLSITAAALFGNAAHAAPTGAQTWRSRSPDHSATGMGDVARIVAEKIGNMALIKAQERRDAGQRVIDAAIAAGCRF
jgi:hypothetical protein